MSVGVRTAGEGIRTLDVQLGKREGADANVLKSQTDTTPSSAEVPKMVPCEQNDESKNNNANELAIVADLLASLPQRERQQMIAKLSTTDRAALARMLIGVCTTSNYN